LKTRDAFRAQLIAGLIAGSLVVAPAAYAQKAGAKPKPAAAAAPAAGADKPLDKKQLADAKKHYGDGVAKYNSTDFDGALQDFQAADNIKATPQTARYIGLCLDNLGRFEEAVLAYNRFLTNVPAKLADQEATIKARVAAIQLLPGKLHVTSDPPAVGFSLDGKPQPMPTPADVEVTPGHHTLHFTATGHDPADKDVDVTYASKQEVSVTLPISAAPPPPPPAPVAVVAPPPPPPASAPTPPPPAPHNNTAAWITGGAAVVAIGVGSVFGAMALTDHNNFNNTPTTALADSGENHALIADMAFGVAVTLGVTSIVLFLSHDDAPPAAATPAASAAHKTNLASAKKTRAFTITPSPIVTMHGAGAGALIQF
jgi:hypothetical protein